MLENFTSQNLRRLFRVFDRDNDQRMTHREFQKGLEERKFVGCGCGAQLTVTLVLQWEFWQQTTFALSASSWSRLMLTKLEYESDAPDTALGVSDTGLLCPQFITEMEFIAYFKGVSSCVAWRCTCRELC